MKITRIKDAFKINKILEGIAKVLKTFILKCYLLFKSDAKPVNSNKIRLKRKITCPSSDDNQQEILQKKIPLSKGLPVIGTILDLITAGGAPQLHNYIDKRHKQFGPIFRERLGGTQDAIFVASANLMRSVFLHEGQYPRHPIPDSWLLYNRTHKCQRGLFFMEGEEWFHNRRVLNKLLQNGNLNWLDTHIQITTEQFVYEFQRQLTKSGEESYEIENLELKLYRWSINVICAIMFGSDVITHPDVESIISHFTTIVHKMFGNSAALMTMPPKWAKFLGLKIWREFEKNVDDVLNLGGILIDRFMVISYEMMTEEQRQETLFYKLVTSFLSVEMIKRIFVDLVIAAGDTTAFSSQWVLYLLSQDMQLQENINEIDSKDDTDIIRGLINETLRLYPVAPFIGRYLANDAIIEGYPIKKDTMVLLSLYTAGRNAAHFPDPLTVKPQRWSRNPDTGKLLGVTESHGTLPFAIGARTCIGRRIALKQINTLIVLFSGNFIIKCQNETSIEPILRMVTVPNQTIRLAIKLRDKASNNCL